MKRESMETVPKPKKLPHLSTVMIVLFTVIFVGYKLWSIFFGGCYGMLEDLLAMLTLVLWLVKLIVSLFRKQKQIAVACVFLLAFLIGFAGIQVVDARFFFYKDAMQETAEEISATLTDTEDAFFLPVLHDASKTLGEIHYYRTNGELAICFRERSSTFDYYCYVYTKADPETIIKDPAHVQKLAENWYYINLY